MTGSRKAQPPITQAPTQQTRPAASLSSSLLARKGTASPAMRPQDLTTSPVDDLGWNDMGTAPPVPAVLVARASLTAQIAAADVEPVPIERGNTDTAAFEPRHAVVTPVSAATAARIGRESAARTKGARAAFTLRLDSDRHLRLRLASVATNLSSQHLLTQALDVFLRSIPEVEALVAQLPPAKPFVR